MLPGIPSRRRAALCAFAALAFACAVAPALATSTARAPRLPRSAVASGTLFAPGEAIVRFEPGATAAERRAARESAGVEYDSSLGLPRAQAVEVEGSVQAAVRRLERQPGVAYAQPSYRYEALAVEPPDDTFFEELWGLSDPAQPEAGVSALEAWEDNRGAGQVIAVVDTGVDLTHPDIAGNLWTNPSPDPDDLHGYDFVDEDGDPDDYQFHGTHVAGTAAAIADNAEGVAGVAPEAQIMAVRVLDGDGNGFTPEIAAGIVYAAEHGADVINLSLGGPAGKDEATEDAIALAGSKGAVVVAAAGNEVANNDTKPHTPCALGQANLICVAALNLSGSIASFSNYGAKTVDLAAPGTSILSAKTDYGTALFSEDFESGLGPWTTQAFDGGELWDLSDSAAEGLQSVTDSPGDYGQQKSGADELAVSELFTDAAVDLNGERGCRLHFQTMYEIEPDFDAFVAGAFSDLPFSGEESFDGRFFDGASPGFPSEFEKEDASISNLDDRDDVHPAFGVLSDFEVEFDGAYVDDVRLICRDESYVDAIAKADEYDLPGAGNYIRFNGTSMAAPHVAGVVALVRAAEPSLSVAQVVHAVLDGTSPIPNFNPARPTATRGIADACQAIAVATGGNVEADCPGSEEFSLPAEGGSPPSTGGGTPRASEFEQAVRRPRTFFRQRPPRVIRTRKRKARAVFRFGASASGVTFFCRVDSGLLRKCPARFVRRYRVGRHVVRVFARDTEGNADRTPAVYRFRVKRVG